MTEVVTPARTPLRNHGRAQAQEAGRTIFCHVLERLQADAAAHFRFDDVHLQPVRYEDRPFSHLLRVAVSRPDSTAPDAHVFVKMLKPKARDGGGEKMRQRVIHEFETTRRLHRLMTAQASMGVVRPLACYPDAHTIVTEESPGETLLAHLHRHATWLPSRRSFDALRSTMATVGEWIKVVQAVDHGAGRISLDESRRYVDLRLTRLVADPRGRFSAADRDRVLRCIDALASQVPEADLADVLVHADLALGNILVSADRVVVLDLAMAHRGSRLHDLTRLYLQLDLLCAKPQFRRSTIEALQLSLLRAFDLSLSTETPLFRLLLLTHRVNNLATLSLRPARFPASLYDAHVRRLHRAWIERETGLLRPSGTESS